MKKLAFLLAIVSLAANVNAQQLKLGDNPSQLQRSAILELQSSNQGLLLSRINDTSAAPLSTAPDGMIIYLTSDNSLRIRENGNWTEITDARNLPASETDPVAKNKSISLNSGTGITVSGSSSQLLGNNPSFQVTAQNTAAIWNADELQGHAISNAAPADSEYLGWNGSSYQAKHIQYGEIQNAPVYYNRSGKITVTKIWADSVHNTSSGTIIVDISSATFSSINNVQVTAYGTSNQPLASVSNVTNNSITISVTQTKNYLLSALGLNILGLTPSTDKSIIVYLRVEGN